MNEMFRKFAQRTSNAAGSSWAFIAALMLVIGWAASGPLFGFSEVWQLVINTSTTIITFLMIFLVQNTQNRDSKAMHIKIDELLRVQQKAHTELVGEENKSESTLKRDEKKIKKEAKNRKRKKKS